jgi:plastocyanin
MPGLGRRAAVIGAVLAVAMLGAACSSNGGSTAGSSSAGSGEATLSAKDFAFTPTTLDVPTGSVRITVTNSGPSKHNFTMDDGSVSQDILPGQTKTITVNLTATATFHCKYHPTTMKGTLQVG